uniref:Peptidase M15A C-terminal domain-containing protein n=1 Tax=Prevotella sp. GTC17259 TaxID=3236795 RepID=A0AB33JBP9_9BACT
MDNKNQNMMLSPHFSLWEMTCSGTAEQLGIENIPNAGEVENLRLLCKHVLEPLRQRFGRIIITSGFRCEALNNRVRGVPTSQHLCGQAADIHISNREMGMRYFNFIKDNLVFDQLLFERRLKNGCLWLHVSYNASNNRRKIGILSMK